MANAGAVTVIVAVVFVPEFFALAVIVAVVPCFFPVTIAEFPPVPSFATTVAFDVSSTLHSISSFPLFPCSTVRFIVPPSATSVSPFIVKLLAYFICFTVTSHVALFPLQLAVIVAVPAATAFIVAVVPFPVTATILGLLLDHVILPSKFIKFAVIVASSAVPSTICNVFLVSVNAIPSAASIDPSSFTVKIFPLYVIVFSSLFNVT